MNIDDRIDNINKVINDNISNYKNDNRGLLSNNILSQLRNLVEHIMMKIYSVEENISFEFTEEYLKTTVKFIRSKGQYRLLYDFHRLLQNSKSHSTPNYDNAERLMLKYYAFLLRIRELVNNRFNMTILENIEQFPINQDTTYIEYYEKISNKINCLYNVNKKDIIEERFYVQKIKPFFVNSKIYYEVTLTPARDFVSKFDRIIAFTNLEISDNYAIRASIVNTNISIFDKDIPIKIIVEWMVSIRPCELSNLMKIFGINLKISSSNKEYYVLMQYLTDNHCRLLDLAEISKEEYDIIKNSFKQVAKVTPIFDLIDECRNILEKNSRGANIIRYFLHRLNNKVIKAQLSNKQNIKLSNLYLEYGSIPFDDMPFATSLIDHNPDFYDLLECINCEDRQDEMLARFVKNNTEINGQMFTKVDDLVGFDNISELIKSYNKKLYKNHRYREMVLDGNFVYIREYVDDIKNIINILLKLSTDGIKGYQNYVQSWLQQPEIKIDCQEKEAIIKRMFIDSKLAMLYGAAGTGKTTLINYLSMLFYDKKKLLLANTNPAVDNLKMRIKVSNCTFSTIYSYLNQKKYIDRKYDILIIDECSTVSNSDIISVLNTTEYDILLLVGDIYQIESISFGNWFYLARFFIPNKCIFELTVPYRTTDNALIKLWNKVREIDMSKYEDITEYIAHNNYSSKIDESIFAYNSNDEIILCLNYDGLYGVNNINRFLQINNPNPAIPWGIYTYKVGDPILFNESQRFYPILYNNLKGSIINIELLGNRIQFDIEVDKAITELDVKNVKETGLQLIDSNSSNKSIIRFTVNMYKNTDDDDTDPKAEYIVPFNIAYAVSIHKSQGLEYESVKIVITSEIEEMITHNIFYTAITRAKSKLKIYWSPETQNRILENLKPLFNKDGVNILASKFDLIIYNN